MGADLCKFAVNRDEHFDDGCLYPSALAWGSSSDPEVCATRCLADPECTGFHKRESGCQFCKDSWAVQTAEVKQGPWIYDATSDRTSCCDMFFEIGKTGGDLHSVSAGERELMLLFRTTLITRGYHSTGYPEG